jgi:hypothetical protein
MAVVAAARQAATVTLSVKLGCWSAVSAPSACKISRWVAICRAHRRSRRAGVEMMSLFWASRASLSAS